MKKTVIAAIVACSAALSGGATPAFADSLTIRVNPGQPVVKRVVVRPAANRLVVVGQPCYTKVVKKVYNRKTVVTKTRVCP